MRENPEAGVPRPALWLGFSGLLPQAAALAVLLLLPKAGQATALLVGQGYAGLILGFLGGSWFAFAASSRAPVPTWIWCAAVSPSLIAGFAMVPVALGKPWPEATLTILGISLIVSLGVDRWLVRAGVTPVWWLALRTPLSLGLGFLTLALAFCA